MSADLNAPISIESLDPLYRDVFRDPANGAPDNISKAGCLALARLGKDAWNAWRVAYPTPFVGARFYSDAWFSGRTWNGTYRKINEKDSAKKWGEEHGLAPNEIEDIDFNHAKFFQRAEEAKAAPWFKRPLYGAYWAFSDYGDSIARPFILLFVTWIVCAAIYGSSAGLSACLPFQNACSIDSTWAEFSLVQSLPLPGLDKLSETLRQKLFPPDRLIGVGVTLAVILHKAILLLTLFLGGLALRNLFKLK
ncbi:MAG: hypothetical protein QM533_06590 [Cytophagales bacterium]|nr:hypothetical protein [Cytophagales bacterium]